MAEGILCYCLEAISTILTYTTRGHTHAHVVVTPLYRQNDINLRHFNYPGVRNKEILSTRFPGDFQKIIRFPRFPKGSLR